MNPSSKDISSRFIDERRKLKDSTTCNRQKIKSISEFQFNESPTNDIYFLKSNDNDNVSSYDQSVIDTEFAYRNLKEPIQEDELKSLPSFSRCFRVTGIADLFSAYSSSKTPLTEIWEPTHPYIFQDNITEMKHKSVSANTTTKNLHCRENSDSHSSWYDNFQIPIPLPDLAYNRDVDIAPLSKPRFDNLSTFSSNENSSRATISSGKGSINGTFGKGKRKVGRPRKLQKDKNKKRMESRPPLFPIQNLRQTGIRFSDEPMDKGKLARMQRILKRRQQKIGTSNTIIINGIICNAKNKLTEGTLAQTGPDEDN